MKQMYNELYQVVIKNLFNDIYYAENVIIDFEKKLLEPVYIICHETKATKERSRRSFLIREQTKSIQNI